MKSSIILASLLICITAISGCNGEAQCYDPDLEASMVGVACTTDCPQVCGCDGNTYCNSCNAASAGIAVDYEGPCN